MRYNIALAKFRVSKMRRCYKLLLTWFMIISIATICFAPTGFSPTDITFAALYISFAVVVYLALGREMDRVAATYTFEETGHSETGD